MSVYKGTTLIAGSLPNAANQDLSNLSQTGQAVIDGKVSKSGDTMTGQLIITSSETRIEQNDTGVVKGTNPSSNTYWGIIFNASGGDDTYQSKRLGYIEETLKTDGSTTLNIGTYQNVANSTTASKMSLNMTQAGVASCTFPNTTCVDGQWVNSFSELVSGVSMSNTTKTISLNNYLPNDGRIYEVLFTAIGRTGSTSGNYMIMTLNGGIVGGNVEIGRSITRSSSYTNAGGNVILPCRHGTNVTLKIDSNATCTNIYVAARAYRRIGTNN